QATDAKLTTAVRIGSSLLGAIFGRKRGFTGVSSTVSGASRVMRESRETAAAQAELDRIEAEVADVEKQFEEDKQSLAAQYDPAALAVETVKLTPLKKNISVTATGILWLPCERVGQELRNAWE
ncbi:MAG TPA: hypothetical protein VD994_10980, partial [Prosthecobacter sp.]|nr:hypothetical protein [Prosthecobacter sp.]